MMRTLLTPFQLHLSNIVTPHMSSFFNHRYTGRRIKMHAEKNRFTESQVSVGRDL